MKRIIFQDSKEERLVGVLHLPNKKQLGFYNLSQPRKIAQAFVENGFIALISSIKVLYYFGEKREFFYIIFIN